MKFVLLSVFAALGAAMPVDLIQPDGQLRGSQCAGHNEYCFYPTRCCAPYVCYTPAHSYDEVCVLPSEMTNGTDFQSGSGKEAGICAKEYETCDRKDCCGGLSCVVASNQNWYCQDLTKN